MHVVGKYKQVRMACLRGGMAQRNASREYGVSRETVRKMLDHAEPPGYRRSKPAPCPKLGGFKHVIDHILEEDKKVPKKQRHTGKKIYQRLHDEYGFTGGKTIVSDYIRLQKHRSKETYVPLSHDPGHAQVDFGESWADIGGVRMKVHCFVLSLPYSGSLFVKAYPAETTEAFCDGHVSAFSFFGGVALSIVYDNTKIAVARILGNRERLRTQVFTRLQSHYLFEDKFARPAKGNEKGHVEGDVGFSRRNFMVPIPSFTSFEELNADLEQQCLNRQNDTQQGRKEPIGERLIRDLDALMDLPATAFDPCEHVSTRANSLSMVRYRCNDYSVPVAYAHFEVQIRGYVDRVEIACKTELIARHKRSYDKGDMVFDPLHYLPLLEQKINALDQAAPLKGWDLPEEFATLRRLFEARLGHHGKREYVRILRLLESFSMDDVLAGVRQALTMGAISYEAIRMLVLCRKEKLPPKLDLDVYPFLPRATVMKTQASSYMTLLGGAS